jgi:hypothetical protein
MYKALENVHVVGLGHKARNGKDTTAAVLQEYFGSDARRYAFADSLRAVCRVVYGMEDKDAPLLQTVGTELFRMGQHSARTSDGRILFHPTASNISPTPDPEVWARTTYWTIAEQQPRVAIISDVRFLNEAQMIKDMGGTLIKCVRRTSSGRQFIDPTRSATHPSETDLDDYEGWDYVIDAYGIAQLEYQAVLICEKIAKKIHDLQD